MSEVKSPKFKKTENHYCYYKKKMRQKYQTIDKQTNKQKKWIKQLK